MKHPILASALGLIALAEVTIAAPPAASKDEQIIWEKERAYWRYVEKNDLEAYANLWHEKFLGWPSVSPAPVHKDHITDWITSETSKGLSFESRNFKPAALQVTKDVASCCYWITLRWLDKEGNGVPSTIRITHTWLRTNDEWRIISGMSMPEPKAAPK